MSSPLRRIGAFAALLSLIVTFAVLPRARRASAQVAPACAQVPSGVVSWYPADENFSEDGNAVDIVGGNNGTLMNGATFAPGKVGTAFSLDGVDDQIEVPNRQSLELNQLTIDAWINRTTTADARIVDKISTDANDGYALDIVDKHLRLIIGDASVTGATPIGTDAFVLVAGTFDGTNLRVYVNGVLDGTTTVESTTTPANSLSLHIGSDSTGSGGMFPGLIDEVELFNRALSQPEIQLIVDADSAGKCRASRGARIIISEFRFRGPGTAVRQGVAGAKQTGARRAPKSVSAGDPSSTDEFIELYNDSDSDVTVSTADGSLGWSLVAETNAFAPPPAHSPAAISQNGVVFAVIANGTFIPARAHFLVANDLGYSLGSPADGYPAGPSTTASPDLVYGNFDIPDDGGVALFATADESRFSFATRLDAVGFAGPQREELSVRSGGKRSPAASNILFFEDTPIPDHVSVNAQHSFIRLLATGRPQDSDNNAADFQLVSTDLTGLQNAVLGAPGPENLSSPLQRSLSLIRSSLIDPCVLSSSPPNRERDTSSSDPATHTTLGTLAIRRRFTNSTSQAVTKLRFRIVDITTLSTPRQPLGIADLRAISSSPTPVPASGEGCAPSGSTINLQGLTLEEPPFQPNGGGLNSSLRVGTVNLNAPLAPGSSVALNFLFGVERQGNFRAFVIVEASFAEPVSNAATPRAKQKRTTGDSSTSAQGSPKSSRKTKP